MFKSAEQPPPTGRSESSRPGRLEEMIIYARLALQNVGGPGYDPYNSPAASGLESSGAPVPGHSSPQAGN